MRHFFLLANSIILFLYSTLCCADATTIWYISSQGNDDNKGSLSEPFATIQHGIEVANENDIVLVQSGIYTEQIDFLGKNITVASHYFTTNKTEYIEQTIIHGNDKNSVVSFTNDEKETALLTGFTITHGKTTENGGGIYLNNNAQPRLENLIITQNQAVNGGGIAILRAKPTLKNLTIKENSAYDGGGIYIGENNKIELHNSIITNNQASHSGGGIYSQKQLNLQLIENTITNNVAEMGGGIYVINTRGTFILDNIQRNSVYDNHAIQGNDLYVIQNATPQPVTLYFNIFSVKEPTPYHIFSNQPLSFDILNTTYHQVDSDLYVSPKGSDKNEGTTANQPLKTIGTAISKLLITAPRTIYLQEGVYSPSNTGENYPLILPSDISLQGQSENTTILDAEQQARVIYFKDVQNNVLTDITLKNGYAEQGGGIYIENANPILQNLTITDNLAIGEKIGQGGGIFSFNNSLVTLTHVSILHNQSAQGGAIYLQNSDQANHMRIENSLIADNNSTIGSGIFSQISTLKLENVTLSHNMSEQTGSALYCIDCIADIQNTVIWHNTPSPIVITHTEYASTLTIDYSAIQQGQAGIEADNTNLINWLAHNIADDPQFINVAMGNYQLQATSPLIDAGNSENIPLLDRLGNERQLPIDIGAYEYQPQPICYYNVVLTTDHYTAAGGTGTISVTTFDNCDWHIDLPDNTWMTIDEAKENKGTGTLSYNVAANNTAYQRNLQLTVAEKSINIIQTGLNCDYTIQPNYIEYTAESTTGNITVTSPEGCHWIAGSNDAWISLIEGNNGNGSDTVSFFVNENSSDYPRRGTIKVADRIFIIKQAAYSPCSYQLKPETYQVNASGGIASVAITTAENCQWTAGSYDVWLSLLSGNVGRGNGNVDYFIASNPNESNRIGSLKIADNIFTVTQTDLNCTYQINALTNYYDAKVHEDSLNIVAPHDCRWNVMTNATWINLLSSNTGLGNGTIRYTIQANNAQEKRIATLAIEGQSVKITQLGKGPTYLLDVTPTKGGSVTSTDAEHLINCSENDSLNCHVRYENEAVVTLVAQNDANWTFKNWTGDCQTATKNLCALSMDSDKQVTAVFESLQSYTNLYLEVSSPTILHKGQLKLTGKINRFPDRAEDLSNLPISLTITAPNGAVSHLQTTTHTDTGQYTFAATELPVFDQEGNYIFQAHFAATETLIASDSLSQSVLVGKSAGYAILIQGKIANEEGIAAHQKTLSRVYKKLLGRGFEAENIHYFGYGDGQTIPNESVIQSALHNLQPKVNGSPAPIYFILVDHGGKEGEFFIDNGHDEKITPELLASWIKSFEMGLTNKAFIDSARVIIIGACYSGSFIPALSGRGRVIITSAAADEASYKGLLELDGIRSGEFFIDELFHALSTGKTLKNAFEIATQRTEIYTRQGGIATHTNSIYQDDAVQHPLLDDNGDQEGSNQLENIITDSIGFNDGFGHSQDLYLGVGVDNNTNYSDVDIISVTETLYLTSKQTVANLWIMVNDAKRINSAPVDIRLPTIVLPFDNQEEYTEQLEIRNMQREFLSCTQETQICRVTTGNLFEESGKYELFYFVRDNQTDEVSAIQRSVVYKNRPNNHLPNANFRLLSPANQTESQTVLVFDWENTTDPDNEPLTYNLLIGPCNLKQDQLQSIVYKKEELVYSMAAMMADTPIKVDDASHKGLVDQARYCWQVEAVDSFGGLSKSEVWTFTTNNPNAPYGVQSINVIDVLTKESVKAVDFSVKNQLVSVYSEQAQILLTAPEGIKALQAEIAAPGYQLEQVTITPENAAQTVALEPIATFSIETGKVFLPIVNVIGSGYYSVTLQADSQQNDVFHLVDFKVIYQSSRYEATFNNQTGELSIPMISLKETPAKSYQVQLQQQSQPAVFNLIDYHLF